MLFLRVSRMRTDLTVRHTEGKEGVDDQPRRTVGARLIPDIHFFVKKQIINSNFYFILYENYIY